MPGARPEPDRAAGALGDDAGESALRVGGVVPVVDEPAGDPPGLVPVEPSGVLPEVVPDDPLGLVPDDPEPELVEPELDEPELVEPELVEPEPDPVEPELEPEPELAEPQPLESVVVVVDLRGFEERGPDEDVVALATPGGVAAGVGSAMAIPPPSDRAPTIRSTPAPARAWLVRLRRSISNASSPGARVGPAGDIRGPDGRRGQGAPGRVPSGFGLAPGACRDQLPQMLR
jgi:hypothetical protein